MKNLQQALKEKTLVLGMKMTLRRLREGKAKTVFLASNCSEDVARTIEYYAKLLKIEVVKLDMSNEEIGTMCKKQFAISMLCC